ncbi:uncharacterized protein LOC135929388 isoform X2 [Gordionus sp. m RMFG-2023]|uniref:uncharacterized protein LOC135929388 isoform X2 n=1 Tax=Gordionus sp. m RMFG-2023 TaxID=3053472 RepID=UPI0031FE087F
MEQKDKREDIFLTSDSKKTLYCEEKSNNEKISKQEEEYEHINELINYIINYHDPTTNQLLCEAFKMLPSRNEYPDYYDIIKEPIDLTMIMEHINNVEYDSLTSLYKDLTLMVKNAKTYNEPGSWIYKHANQFKKLFTTKKMELEHSKNITQADSNMNSNKTSDRLKRTVRMKRASDMTSVTTSDDEYSNATDATFNNQSNSLIGQNVNFISTRLSTNNQGSDDEKMEDNSLYWKLYEEIRYLEDPSLPNNFNNSSANSGTGGTVKLSDPFNRLPSSYHYPDYYEEITKPMALTQIKAKIKKNMYTSMAELLDDFFLMFNNAMAYNISDSKIYKDALFFKRYLRRKLSEEQHTYANILPSDYLTNLDNSDPSLMGPDDPNLIGDDSNPMSSDDANLCLDDHLPVFKKSRGRPPKTAPTNNVSVGIKNIPKATKEPKENDTTKLMGRLVEAYNEITRLEDENGYKLALHFIKKLNDPRANFADFTDIERALREGQYTSVTKLLGDAFKLVQAFKTHIYNVPNEPSSIAGYRAAEAMQSFLLNNAKFKEIIASENNMNTTAVYDGNKRSANLNSAEIVKEDPSGAGLTKALRSRLQDIYNELMNFQDRSSKKSLAAPFLKLPLKSEYPDYYQIITQPIDLTTINRKLYYNNNISYQTAQEFFSDLDLMLENAFTFNDPESTIYKEALQLYRFVCEKKTELYEEIKGKPDVQLRVRTIFVTIYVGLITHQDNRGVYYSDTLQDIMQGYSEKLRDLPGYFFPSYFKGNPMNFETIKRYLDTDKYTRLDVFQDHVLHCLKKALFYALSKKFDHQTKSKAEISGNISESKNDFEQTKCVNAGVELMNRYFVLRDRVCLRTVKVSQPPSSELELSDGHERNDRYLRYFVLRSLAAFNENKNNSEFPKLVKNFLVQGKKADEKKHEKFSIKTENCNNSITNMSVNEDDCATEETNSNSNDVNSSFGDWKKGLDDSSMGMEGFEVNGETYYAGDFVYLEPSEKSIPDPHILCVQQFSKDPETGLLNVQGCWFYRPYETFHPAGKRFYNQEVFKSDYYDKLDAHKILGKCLVMFFKDYVKYKPMEFESKNVYVCESRYFTKIKAFKKIKHWNHISAFPSNESNNNHNKITFVQRDATLILPKTTPSVFVDKTYSQFLEENSYVPNFPDPNQEEIPLTEPPTISPNKSRASLGIPMQKVFWPIYTKCSSTTPSPISYVPLKLGDYVLISYSSANRQNKKTSTNNSYNSQNDAKSPQNSYIIRIDSLRKPENDHYILSGQLKFLFDPYVPGNFTKNAKDVFLTPIDFQPTMFLNLIDSMSPTKMDNDFVVVKRVFVLGAETFSKKWPTEIEEKDIYVCRYRFSMDEGSGDNADKHVITPLIYENFCHKLTFQPSLPLQLLDEWYHFDADEIYNEPVQSPDSNLPQNLMPNNAQNTNIGSNSHLLQNSTLSSLLARKTMPTDISEPSVSEVFFGSGESGGNLGVNLGPAPDNFDNNVYSNTKLDLKEEKQVNDGSNTIGNNLKKFCLDHLGLLLDEEDYKYIQKKAKPSGYIVYSGERRQLLMEKYPELKFGDISKLIGNEWKLLNADQKASFEEKAIVFGDELRALLEDGNNFNYDNAFNNTTGGNTPNDRLAKRIKKLIRRSQQLKKPSISSLPLLHAPSSSNSMLHTPSSSNSAYPDGPDYSSNGSGFYACMWADCDIRFEHLQDLVDHVTLQTDHVKSIDGEYTCNWSDCWKNGKDKEPKPFSTQGRLIKHLKDSHFKNYLINYGTLDKNNKNLSIGNTTVGNLFRTKSGGILDDYDSSNTSFSLSGLPNYNSNNTNNAGTDDNSIEASNNNQSYFITSRDRPTIFPTAFNTDNSVMFSKFGLNNNQTINPSLITNQIHFSTQTRPEFNNQFRNDNQVKFQNIMAAQRLSSGNLPAYMMNNNQFKNNESGHRINQNINNNAIRLTKPLFVVPPPSYKNTLKHSDVYIQYIERMTQKTTPNINRKSPDLSAYDDWVKFEKPSLINPNPEQKEENERMVKKARLKALTLLKDHMLFDAIRIDNWMSESN